MQHYYIDAVKGDWGSEYGVVALAGNLLLNIIADMPYDKAQLFIEKAAFTLKIGGYIFVRVFRLKYFYSIGKMITIKL